MKPLKKYLLALFVLHKTVFIWPINQLILSKTIRISITAANIKFLLKRSNLRVFYENESGLYYIVDGDTKHYFGDLQRVWDYMVMV